MPLPPTHATNHATRTSRTPRSGRPPNLHIASTVTMRPICGILRHVPTTPLCETSPVFYLRSVVIKHEVWVRVNVDTTKGKPHLHLEQPQLQEDLMTKRTGRTADSQQRSVDVLLRATAAPRANFGTVRVVHTQLQQLTCQMDSPLAPVQPITYAAASCVKQLSMPGAP